MLLKPAACFVLGSLLAAGGPGSVESCLLASLPGEDSLCSMNATPWSSRDPRFPTRPGCHPLWCQDAAHPCPKLQPVVPIHRAVPPEKCVLAAWGEMPKDFTAGCGFCCGNRGHAVC